MPAGTVAPLTMTAGGTETVNVAPLFTDPDGDALAYGVTTSDATVAEVGIVGDVVTITARSAGSTTLSFTATDPGGLSASQAASLTVRWRTVTDTWAGNVTVDGAQWRWRFNLRQDGVTVRGEWSLGISGFSGLLTGSFHDGSVDYPAVSLSGVITDADDPIPFSYQGQLTESAERMLGIMSFTAGLVTNLDMSRVR